ncbi:AAA family ATPase [Halorubellus sp. JP-L1]|uniref:Cdc6/Cdc18 family protein n=1 Tax=Halorubellus sp. JP-L1 TaxID=2715753 RepID=UPI00140C788B|nr:AAA family ATPase [Halorubellus sp. JP-L1]
MIRDARVLRTDFVPSEVVHRDGEVNHLSSVLDPVTRGQTADTAVVTGPSGAGKTCLTRFVAGKLREATLDVETVYVNCWRNYTRYRALYRVLEAVGRTVDVHRQSTPTDELIDRIERADQQAVVVLDEADQLEAPDVIYDLHGLPQYAVVVVANRERDLYAHEGNRLRSRLQSSEHVRMDTYGADQLVAILQSRVDNGLERGVVDRAQLERIADAAAGDARLAIGILRSAARAAEREDEDEITDAVLEDAVPTAETEIRQADVENLTPDQVAVFEVVRERGPVSPGGIYDAYCERVDDPKTERTIRSYLSKMQQYDLLVASGSSRTRVYEVVDDDLPSPGS